MGGGANSNWINFMFSRPQTSGDFSKNCHQFRRKTLLRNNSSIEQAFPNHSPARRACLPHKRYDVARIRMYVALTWSDVALIRALCGRIGVPARGVNGMLIGFYSTSVPFFIPKVRHLIQLVSHLYL